MNAEFVCIGDAVEWKRGPRKILIKRATLIMASKSQGIATYDFCAVYRNTYLQLIYLLAY